MPGSKLRTGLSSVPVSCFFGVCCEWSKAPVWWLGDAACSLRACYGVWRVAQSLSTRTLILFKGKPKILRRKSRQGGQTVLPDWIAACKQSRKLRDDHPWAVRIIQFLSRSYIYTPATPELRAKDDRIVRKEKVKYSRWLWGVVEGERGFETWVFLVYQDTVNRKGNSHAFRLLNWF